MRFRLVRHLATASRRDWRSRKPPTSASTRAVTGVGSALPGILIIWLVLCALLFAAWASRHGEISRAAREERNLRPRSYPPFEPGQAPRLSVLVAAKDEESSIETCVRTLLDQDYPNFEIVAANDRSTDATGAILDRLKAEHPDRLKVVHVRRLPDGWFGKNNAMREAVAQADGDWLCFVDADCRQVCRSTLTVAVREALTNRLDFLSVLPVLETRSFWERIIQPVCGAILVLWFNPKRVNDPKSKAAYANGAFMLMSRENYEAIGGHAAVRTELNEDIHLARLTKHSGRKLYVVLNEGLYLTRMYSSFAASWRGWSRIFFGCFGSFRRLSISMLVLCMMSILPFAGMTVSAIAALTVDGPEARWWAWAAVAGLAVVVMLESVMYRYMKLTHAARWAWVAYSLGAVLGLGILANAMLKLVGAGTTWRGTTYRRDQRVLDEGEPAAESTASSPAAADAA